MNGSGPGAISSEGGRGLNQSRGSAAEPSLEQNQSNFPRTSSGTGYITGPETGFRTGSEIVFRTGSKTGSKIGPELVPSNSSTRMKSKSVNLSPWKHQSLHPLDQILSNINARVQTRAKPKNYCAFYV